MLLQQTTLSVTELVSPSYLPTTMGSPEPARHETLNAPGIKHTIVLLKVLTFMPIGRFLKLPFSHFIKVKKYLLREKKREGLNNWTVCHVVHTSRGKTKGLLSRLIVYKA